MYSHDEFKELLNQKKLDFEKVRRFRRKKFLSAAISLVLCVALVVAWLNRPLMVRAQDLMDGVNANPVSGTAPDEAFIVNQMRFSLELLKACQNGENTLISPLSIALALGMAANGAAGQTRQEMQALLTGGMEMAQWNGYMKYYVNQLVNTDKAKLSIANAIWFRDCEDLTVRPEFLQTNADYFGADAYAAAFDKSTVRDINNWVEHRTDGLIDQVIDRIDEDTMLYLINTLLFDAQWRNVYRSYQVRDGSFTAADGTVRDVEMMYCGGYGYLDDGSARGFVKDYAEGYRFVALLPNEGIAVEDYVRGLTWEGLLEMLRHPQDYATSTGLPKFSYEDEIQLKEVLARLGMETAFQKWEADFSPMGTYRDGNLYIGQVLHKTTIQMAEKGTKAGAVTVIEQPGATALPDIQRIILDRPFLYLIVDQNNNLPIFMGIVNDIP